MPFFSVKNRKDWKVVVLCLLAAATFWFLHAMNNDYKSTVEYPISVVHGKQHYNTSIELEVKGSGWDILYSKVGYDIQEVTYELPAVAPNSKIASYKFIKNVKLPSMEVLSYPDSVSVVFK